MLYRTNYLGKALLLLCAIVLLQNCTENYLVDTDTTEATAFINMDEATDVQSLGEETVESRTRSFFTFNTLNKALECTGLGTVLGEGENTIYAPSDAAFAKLGLDAHNVCEALDAAALAELLSYHVTGGLVSVHERGCLEMANGDITQLSSKRFKLFINDSQIYLAFTQVGHDYKLRVFAIADVLTLPEPTIVGAAASTDVFESLVAAVLAAEPAIVTALSDPDEIFTVFAPTNQAFADLAATLGVSTLDEVVDLVGVDALSLILLYHVVDACAFSNDLEDGQELTTLQGEPLKVDLNNLSIIDRTEMPANLEIELLDILTTNGVVHGIDKVLLPQAILDNL